MPVGQRGSEGLYACRCRLTWRTSAREVGALPRHYRDKQHRRPLAPRDAPLQRPRPRFDPIGAFRAPHEAGHLGDRIDQGGGAQPQVLEVAQRALEQTQHPPSRTSPAEPGAQRALQLEYSDLGERERASFGAATSRSRCTVPPRTPLEPELTRRGLREGAMRVTDTSYG